MNMFPRSSRRNQNDDDIHVNYVSNENANSGFRGKVTNWFARPEDEHEHSCCWDVWGGFLKAAKKGTPRECSNEETYQINFFKVFAKQITSGVLFGLVVWYIHITASLRFNEFPTLFDCDPDSNTSIIQIDGVAGEFEDEGVQFCYFKNVMILVSFAFLFPFLLETFSVLTIIWVSAINSSVLVPVVDGKYVGYDDIFNAVHSTNVFRRSFECLLVVFKVPMKIYQLNKEATVSVSNVLLFSEMAWKLVVFMIPDILLTTSLFGVSYFVMVSSDTPEDILVNLVAVQVFAELDDIFVKMLFSPRASCGERIVAYVNDNPNADRALYSPFQAYSLNENRHEMGIKVKNMKQMKYFHDYTGHHLTS